MTKSICHSFRPSAKQRADPEQSECTDHYPAANRFKEGYKVPVKMWNEFVSMEAGVFDQASRGRAKKIITLAEHEKATKGVMCRKDAGALDEFPAAYKSIGDAVAV
jgi:hypothetical protein